MKWNQQTKEKARELVEAMNEEQCSMIVNLITCLLHKPSEEEKAKDKEEREERDRQTQIALADFGAKRLYFDGMRESVNEGPEIPEKYEWQVDEVQGAFEMAFHPLAGHEEVFDLADYMFTLGFKRGMACQKSRMGRNSRKKPVKNG